MDQLARERESGELERKYTKKERVILGREAVKLATHFGGISTLTKLPDVMVVVDPRHDVIAVEEARQMKVPVVGIMSSDCDVAKINYPVLVNDALQSSVTMVLGELVAAYEEGRTQAATVAAKPKA
jgi:small subunit ribosomal protein S2